MGRLGRVLVACALFALVEYAVWVAVLLWAYDRGGAGLAGFVSVVQLLPATLLAPAAGALGDRLPRGTALVLAYGAEAVALVATTIALRTDAVVAVVVCAALTTTTVSVARPVHHAALPQLAASPRSLVTANSASGVVDGVGAFVGPVLAGVVAQGSGPWSVTAVSAVLMLAAALLCLGLGLPAPVRDTRGGALRDSVDGVRELARDRAVFALLLLVGALFLVAGALEVLGVAFAYEVLGEGDDAAGLLVGAVGIGALVGAAAAMGLAIRPRLSWPTVVGMLVAGAPLLAMAATGTLPLAVALLAASGLGTAFTGVAGRTLLQRSTDDRLLARAFAVQEGVTLAGLAIGAALAPVLVSLLGPGSAYAPLGVGLVAVALAAVPVLRGLERRAVFRADVMTALRRVPFLAAMPPPSLSRLVAHARWVDVAAGAAVITQGDPGDAYYVVESGRFGVDVDGVRRPHELVRGDGFGEIALLRAVPRTATVTAIEPSRLLRLGRDDFLAAVTGSTDGARVAEEIAAAHLERDASHRGR